MREEEGYVALQSILTIRPVTNNNRVTAGSHSFKGLTIRDNVTVSLGNVSNPSSILPHMAGHFFIDFTASGNKFLHIGNAGSNSEGHIFDVGVVEKNEATMLGDYADLEHKFREISLQRGGHSHQTVRADM